jgi:hypothetical protein
VVTSAYEEDEPTPPTKGQRVESAIRSAITGGESGVLPVRRMVLYVIAAFLVVTNLPVLAVVPLVLLAMTDKS